VQTTGTKEEFHQKRDKLLLLEVLLFGFLIIMGGYEITLFLFRRNDKAPLFFGLFCIFLGLRSIMIGQRVSHLIFSDFSWQLHQRLEYLFLYLCAPPLALYIAKIFPKDISSYLWKISLWASVVLSFFNMILPVSIIPFLRNIFQVVVYLLTLYLLFALIKIFLKKRTGRLLFSLGSIGFVFYMINETLYSLHIIHTVSHSHFSIFIITFTLLQAFLLSSKTSLAFETINKMRLELEQNNRELIKMDNLKNEFLANTSHELKTPLNGIIGIAESMLDSVVNNKAYGFMTKEKKNLSMIASSGRRLYSLINDLLDFSRMKQGGFKLNIKPVDIKCLAELVIKMSLPLTGDKPVTLKCNIHENAQFVSGDENRLQQILFNLVGNAIKFTFAGEVLIKTELHGDHVKIIVSDTGIGINKDDYGKIFNAFEQVDGSLSRTFHGAGIGLAVSQKLAALHGSKIFVKSKINSGTEFFFSLSKSEPAISKNIKTPIVSSFLETVEFEQSNDSETNRTIAKTDKTILVVDDEPINIQLINTLLNSYGYIVLTAHNGYEALEILEERGDEEQPDLVLLDIMMPGINGFDVCTKIREKHDLYSLPIIFFRLIISFFRRTFFLSWLTESQACM